MNKAKKIKYLILFIFVVSLLGIIYAMSGINSAGTRWMCVLIILTILLTIYFTEYGD